MLRLNAENQTWGYRRIHARYVGSAPHRRSGRSCATPDTNQPLRDRAYLERVHRLSSHTVVASDFFNVDTVTQRCYYVLFFIEIDSRRHCCVDAGRIRAATAIRDTHTDVAS